VSPCRVTLAHPHNRFRLVVNSIIPLCTLLLVLSDPFSPLSTLVVYRHFSSSWRESGLGFRMSLFRKLKFIEAPPICHWPHHNCVCPGVSGGMFVDRYFISGCGLLFVSEVSAVYAAPELRGTNLPTINDSTTPPQDIMFSHRTTIDKTPA
jgi:hypothetical protein